MRHLVKMWCVIAHILPQNIATMQDNPTRSVASYTVSYTKNAQFVQVFFRNGAGCVGDFGKISWRGWDFARILLQFLEISRHFSIDSGQNSRDLPSNPVALCTPRHYPLEFLKRALHTFIVRAVFLTVNHDLVEMALPPTNKRFYMGEQCFAQIRDSVFHVWRHVCKELAVDDAVGRKLFEDLRQHFLRDKWDVAVEFVETYRLIL